MGTNFVEFEGVCIAPQSKSLSNLVAQVSPSQLASTHLYHPPQVIG